jgi:hypothetical protein
MTMPNQPVAPEQEMKTVQIIWSSFIAALMIYATLGFFISFQSPQPPQTILVGIFALLSAGQTGMIFIIKKLRIAKTYTSYALVRCAFAEAIAIYGLVARFLGMPIAFMAIFLIWSLTLLLFVVRPSEADRADYKEFTGP